MGEGHPLHMGVAFAFIAGRVRQRPLQLIVLVSGGGWLLVAGAIILDICEGPGQVLATRTPREPAGARTLRRTWCALDKWTSVPPTPSRGAWHFSHDESMKIVSIGGEGTGSWKVGQSPTVPASFPSLRAVSRPPLADRTYAPRPARQAGGCQASPARGVLHGGGRVPTRGLRRPPERF